MTSLHHFENYRDLLKSVLEQKFKRNSAVSLRSQAKAWGLSPSYLSRVLSGQRNLSAKSANKLALALEFQPEESAYLLALVELETAADHKKIKVLEKLNRLKPTEYRQISLDTYNTVADWHHFAILSLAGTKGFRPEAHWISRRLGITPLEAKIAFERLLKLRLLEKHGAKYRAANNGNLTTPDDNISEAIRENHRQHLVKASAALTTTPIHCREFGNLSLPMNLDELPRAKKRIRHFLNRFNQEMEQLNGQEVFQLNIQFYPLSNLPSEKS